MMERKHLLWLLLFLLPCMQTAGQTGQRFCKEGKVWNTFPIDDYITHYIMTGDTIIGGLAMKKVYVIDEMDYRDTDMHYLCAIYEDGSKVSVVYEGTSELHLRYDFSLKAGDNLRYDKGNVQVISDRYCVANSVTRHVQELSGPLDTGDPEYVIGYSYALEGVGNLFNPPFHDPVSSGMLPCAPVFLQSCYEGEKCIYYLTLANRHDMLECQNLNASYKPLLKDGREWLFKDESRQAREYLSGDTLLYIKKTDSVVCTKVYRQDEHEYGDTLFHYVKAMHELGAKVYEIAAGKQWADRRLLFDFGLEVGSSMTIDSREKVSAMVVAIDSVCSEGIGYRRLTLQRMEDGRPTGVYYHWTEGIGSEQGLRPGWDDTGDMLSACNEEGECIYRPDHGSSSRIAVVKTGKEDMRRFDIQGRPVTGLSRDNIYIRNGRKHAAIPHRPSPVGEVR